MTRSDEESVPRETRRTRGTRRGALRFPLRLWLNYRFDEWVSGGFWRMFMLLLVLLAVGACAIAVVRVLVESRPIDGEPFSEAVWQTVFNSLDAGVIASETNKSLRPVMIVATLLGLLILSTLVGVITNKIDARVAGLRHGRTPVCESDHVLILGWNSAIFDLLREIHLSAAGQRAPRVVVLANRDNGEMTDAIARFIETERDLQALRGMPVERRISRPITRAGVPWDPAALSRVHPQYARWILVLTSNDDSDAAAIKTLLALDGHLPTNGRPPIVASVSSHQNVALAQEAAGSSAEVVNADQTIARLLVQTARQNGVGAVLGNLTSFDGEELYSCPAPTGFVGRTLREAVIASDSHSVIGLECPGQRPRLLGGDDVDLDVRIQATDRFWLLASDENDARRMGFDANAEASIDRAAIRTIGRPPRKPERFLIVGWNRRGSLVLDELDQQAPGGSTVLVFDPLRHDVQHELDRDLSRALNSPRTNITKVDAIGVDEDMAAWIERFHRQVRDLREFDGIIVLDDSDTAGEGVRTDLAVARVVLELRRLRAGSDSGWPRVVCEVADERTRDLIRIEHGEEFIASGRFVSSLMTHYALDNRRVSLYENLFDAPSAEICLRDPAEFIDITKPVNWATVVSAFLNHGEIAMGWLCPDGRGGYKVRFDPPRGSVKQTVPPEWRVIVLAERS